MSITTENAATDPSTPPPTGEHPKGLYVLFGAEAWERFSYYGMRALLVLYMTRHLHFDRAHALEIYAMYTGLVYLTPLLGGALADSILGKRKAVLIGGALMALGHLAMAFESLLFPALGLLIIGNGFFKPNISTIVGGLYKENDPRRDGGFTIFYMGINLGAFFSPIVCGFLGEKVSWHVGFSAAAVGMAFGLVVFAVWQRLLEGEGMPPNRIETREVAVGSGAFREGTVTQTQSHTLNTRDYVDVAIWVAGGTAVVAAVLGLWRFFGPVWSGAPVWVKAAVVAAGATVLFTRLFRNTTIEEKQRLTVIIVLCAFNIFFWMGFEQAGGTFTLFADNQTDLNLGWFSMVVIIGVILAAAANIYNATRDQTHARGFWMAIAGLFVLAAGLVAGPGIVELVKTGRYVLPAAQFQAINPLLIVALGPLFSKLWIRLDSTQRFRTSTPTKMAIGMIILGLGFVVMYVGQSFAGPGIKVSPWWLVTVYSIHTIGELCLSPIGLSMITKLAPLRVVSLSMGLWNLSSAIANYLAGSLEGILEHRHVPIYGFLIVSSIGPALVLLALAGPLKRWMHGRE
ncbi:MAG: peptide MFS transporter [Deltaproteobacteria bacterium]|nr:peptide MFS transporter [Deltaproteobacteria bacterium]